ncbi:MAG: hypothetical protein WHS89_13325 [Acidimicrobiales bacterium]|jgi:hypothetical protein
MSIPLKRVSRVVIAGEWYSVELGTFEVLDMEFLDDSGQPTHDPLDVKAYRFETPNHDIYYGPLSAISLIKLLDI